MYFQNTAWAIDFDKIKHLPNYDTTVMNDDVTVALSYSARLLNI